VDRAELGLGKVARVGIYKGFVFGSMAAEGPSLEEHLGAAKGAIDALCLNSPEGEVEITAGFLKHKVKANWKFLVENETDGYHPSFVHASIFEVAQSGIGSLYSAESDRGVARLRQGPHRKRPAARVPQARRAAVWFGTTPDKLPDYVQRMNAAYGETEARRIMIDGTPHIMIFPNLFIAEIQIFVIQPLAVNETVQHVTALQFKGAPDLNRRMRQQTMGSVGPAGFLLADDAEMYERTQLGVQASNPEWLYLGRGKHRERRDENGYLIGDATDETPTRGIWRHYRADGGRVMAMTAATARCSTRSRSSSTAKRACRTNTPTTPGRRCGPTTVSTGCRPTATASTPSRRCPSSTTTARGSPAHPPVPHRQALQPDAASRLRRLVSNVEILPHDGSDRSGRLQCDGLRVACPRATRSGPRATNTPAPGDGDELRLARKKVCWSTTRRRLYSLAFLI
jgi:hypothetical protein